MNLVVTWISPLGSGCGKRDFGETLAVKVRYDQADGQVQGATIGGNSESKPFFREDG